MEKNLAIAELVRRGAVEEKGLRVNSVNVKREENYVRLSFSVDRDIDGFIMSNDGLGVRTLGKTRVVFSSTFSIFPILKENDDVKFVINHLRTHSKAIVPLLSDAIITVYVEKIEVPEGETVTYTDVWRDETEDSKQIFDHTIFKYHITDIKLGKNGKKSLDRIKDWMLFNDDDENVF